MNLTQIEPYREAIVKSFSVSDLPAKLFELGLYAGNPLMVLQKSRFKGSIYLRIGDTYLALRYETAALIEVEMFDADEQESGAGRES